MSNHIELKSGNMFDLAPSEGDDRNGSWISPFSIPGSIQFWNDETGRIRAIEFEYAGGEVGKWRELLDDSPDLPIQLLRAKHTKKIIQMNFATPITLKDFPAVAARLIQKAKSAPTIGMRLNQLMIAKIFENWDSVTEIIG